MTVRIGCSGWNYKWWRGDFYPAKLPARKWLAHYAETFDTVEVNSTFYRLPTLDAVKGWADQTPDGFGFAIKASRYITHVKRLAAMAEGVERLDERIAPLREAGKLAVVLWQLPANFHRDDDRLGAALNELPDGRHAFEFRHPSWFCDDVYDLLRQFDVALVRGDDKNRDLPVAPSPASFAYIRLHYGRRGQRGNYSPTELNHWAVEIEQTRKDVFLYANNDWEGFAPRNAAELQQRLGAGHG